MLRNILNIYCKNIFNNFLIAESCRTRTHFFQKLPSPAPAPAPESRNAPVLHSVCALRLCCMYGFFLCNLSLWSLFLLSRRFENLMSLMAKLMNRTQYQKANQPASHLPLNPKTIQAPSLSRINTANYQTHYRIKVL